MKKWDRKKMNLENLVFLKKLNEISDGRDDSEGEAAKFKGNHRNLTKRRKDHAIWRDGHTESEKNNILNLCIKFKSLLVSFLVPKFTTAYNKDQTCYILFYSYHKDIYLSCHNILSYFYCFYHSDYLMALFLLRYMLTLCLCQFIYLHVFMLVCQRIQNCIKKLNGVYLIITDLILLLWLFLIKTC